MAGEYAGMPRRFEGGSRDIRPRTPVRALNRGAFSDSYELFPLDEVARAVGMSPTFIRSSVGAGSVVDAPTLLALLDQDAYSETFVPRSGVLDYLRRTSKSQHGTTPPLVDVDGAYTLLLGNALGYIKALPPCSVNTVVTSTPYWGMRVYEDSSPVEWADGELAPYGHEQTPEAFLRHTTEVLAGLWNPLAVDGSIWWNVMDTFNTRTQVRGNARETLAAMQGGDNRRWSEHPVRRYSAGHSFLFDGEQCLIPGRIAERASRMGYYVKSVITWAKPNALPEPQQSRVSRRLEYVLHLTKTRTPAFNRDAYRDLPAHMGGRDARFEPNKLSDVWTFAPSAGRDGHGAQFPLALPARCIALSSPPGGVVLDPFVGSGNSGVAALALSRRFVGVEVSPTYLELAQSRISHAFAAGATLNA